MFPLLLLIPGGLLLWSFAKRHAERQMRERQLREVGSGYSSLPQSPFQFSRGPIALPRGGRSGVTTADYLRHLHEASMAARILDMVKPQAAAGDIDSLMQAPQEVATALAILSAPLTIIFAQKDLNVLGASPALPEDGVLGPATSAAIAGIQSRFGQRATGALDAQSAVAIRYAVGCINAQDRANAGV